MPAPPGRETAWAPQGRMAEGTRARRRHQAVGLLVAASVTALTVVAISRSPHPVGPGEASPGGRWAPTSASPLAPRISSSVTWTGTELLAWGGRGCGVSCDQTGEIFADGAAYDPGTDRWRELAPSPLTARAGALAAWTGTEMLIWGGNGPASAPLADGAAYDPALDRWRLLAPGPLAGGSGQEVWTGHDLLVWGATGAAAYDPRTDSWRVLAPAPLSARSDVTIVWAGHEMVVWGGSADGASLADGAAYDPATDRWRLLAPAPLSPRLVRGTWSGNELLIWGGEGAGTALADGAAYDPANDSWRPLAPAPLAGRRGFAEVWTGQEMLVWGGAGPTGNSLFGDGVAYDPATDRWRSLPRWPGRFIPSSVWAGGQMLVWGGLVPAVGNGTGAGGVVPTSDTARYVLAGDPPLTRRGRSH